jgi:hypothetical protein
MIFADITKINKQGSTETHYSEKQNLVTFPATKTRNFFKHELLLLNKY